jgi:hypothetical protein
MGWKNTLKSPVNAALRRAIGHELHPVGERPRSPRPKIQERTYDLADMPPEQRLLTAPVFIISSIRSGSTLLRVILGGHSELHAPHELHLANLSVRLRSRNTRHAMAVVGLDEVGLEHLLWDGLLDRQLRLSGKKILVNKTPSDAFIWRRIITCWPDARFIFLLRHPLSIVRSRQEANPHQSFETHVTRTMRYMTAVDEARRALPGLTVRYEDLTADPERVTRQICAFLDVPWQPEMLDYGSRTDEDFRRGLGDWSEQIRSGVIQPSRPLPSENQIPGNLKELCRAWGYLPTDVD